METSGVGEGRGGAFYSNPVQAQVLPGWRHRLSKPGLCASVCACSTSARVGAPETADWPTERRAERQTDGLAD